MRLAPAARVKAAAARAAFRSLAEAWDAWYGAFYSPEPPGKAAAVAERLAPLVAGRRVLELGCGDGALLAELAPRCRSVQGLDASPRALALARRRCRGLRNARVGALRGWTLPFDDGVFEAAVCQRTLHVLDPEGAVLLLAELRRVLGSRGRLAFNLPNFHHEPHLRALLTPGATPWPARTRPRFWTAGMVRALLPRLGFKIESLRTRSWLEVVAARP